MIVTERKGQAVTVWVTADEQTRRHPFRFALETGRRLVDLWHYRELIRNLVVRDLKVRYKNSAFGFAWSLLNPLFMMLVLSVVFSLVFEEQKLVQNFPAFLVVGLIPWNFTNTSLARVVDSVVENSRLIKKVAFPREVIPISVVLANFVHFVMAIPVLLVILMALGVMPNFMIFAAAAADSDSTGAGAWHRAAHLVRERVLPGHGRGTGRAVAGMVLRHADLLPPLDFAPLAAKTGHGQPPGGDYHRLPRRAHLRTLSRPEFHLGGTRKFHPDFPHRLRGFHPLCAGVCRRGLDRWPSRSNWLTYRNAID